MSSNYNHDDENTAGSEQGLDTASVYLSLDALLELLAYHHRRDILRYLSETSDQTAAINEILNHLTIEEIKRTSDPPGRDQIEMTLHHTPLPKLTQAGVVEYGACSKKLRYWYFDPLEDILEQTQPYEPE